MPRTLPTLDEFLAATMALVKQAAKSGGINAVA